MSLLTTQTGEVNKSVSKGVKSSRLLLWNFLNLGGTHLFFDLNRFIVFIRTLSRMTLLQWECSSLRVYSSWGRVNSHFFYDTNLRVILVSITEKGLPHILQSTSGFSRLPFYGRVTTHSAVSDGFEKFR